MKNPKLGDYLLWRGEMAKIVAIAESRTVVIEMLKDKYCPHCNKSLGKDQTNVIPTSPLFQKNAESIKTMSED